MTPNKLANPFSEDLFSEITEQLIGHSFTKDNRIIDISGRNFKFIKEVKNLGTFSELNLQVFIVKNSSENDARISLSKELFSIMKDYSFSNALIATYNEGDTWRYSLLTSNLSLANDGRVIRSFSNPKRYSYMLGRGAKVATPYKYLIKNGKISDFDDLQKRFSVEVVNNDFYKEIARLYDELVGTSVIKAQITYPQNGDRLHQFAVRLIGRIVFCWFLREKKSDNELPLISSDILSSASAKKENGYYHKILAPLFFEILNRPTHKRAKIFQEGSFGNIPYLNGGLFSDQEDDHYKFDPIIEQSVPGLVNIPDEWIQNFFDLLETYHFTVDENTSIDVDLSIDPEMLGRIFENLLARINPTTGETVRKSTGSFYTPRSIVEYMVDECLVNFLTEKTNINENKIRSIVSYDLTDDQEYPINNEEKSIITKALSSLKVLDPACGSGAFPIGILQKIVFILQQIDPEAKLWFENQINSVPPESRRLIEEEFKNKNFDYIRKLGVIRESIYGVDIQSIATEVARLRCFLTLIVDERVNDNEANRGIYPLPNLDFKFVTANTLIKLDSNKDKKVQLFEDTTGLKELSEIMTEYFNAPQNERDGIKYRFSQTQKKIFERLLNGFRDVSAHTNTYKLSSWDPFEHKSSEWFDPEWMFGVNSGFDIVIGNPPYIQLQKNSGYLAELYKNEGYETFTRTGDIYSLFYERGLELSKQGSGLLCYITSNKWMRAGYGEKTRSYFVRKNPIQLIDFGGFKVFESATVDTNILLIKNEVNKNTLSGVHFRNDYSRNQSIYEYFKQNSYLLDSPNKNAWYIGNSEEYRLKEKIEKSGVILKDYNHAIYRGVLTGCNEAFMIDATIRETLIKKDAINQEIIKPLLRGRDIHRYNSENNDMYILATGYDTDIASRYPVIYEYIKNIGEKIDKKEIKSKGKGVFNRDDQGVNWWNLRACVYYDEFEKEKIAWSDISTEPSFTILKSGVYINNTAYMISGADLYYLLGILNSKVVKWLFPKIATDLGENGTRYFKQFVELIPIPKKNLENIILFNKLEAIIKEYQETVNNLGTYDLNIEKNIDNIVYKLYKLTNEEIDIIEASTND